MTVNLTEARRRWLAELYEANSAAVFKQCLRLLGSREDAADATHEVFLRAAASLTEAADSPRARGWLTTVARNYCIDLLRRRERFGLALTTLAATADPADESVETVEDRQLLDAVLRRMGARERQALWQSAVEDLPVAEIARSFGVSYLAAAQLLHRARRQALVLATRLAVILGLAQLGRALRRSKPALRSQQVAAVVVMPLAIAAFVVSSSPQRPILVQAKSPPGATVQSLPRTAGNPLPGPSASPVPTPAAVARVPAAQLVAVTTAQNPTMAEPTALPPPPSDLDHDRGKGRDRDDSVQKPRHHGKARGHDH